MLGKGRRPLCSDRREPRGRVGEANCSAPFDLLRGLRDANSAKRIRQERALNNPVWNDQAAERRGRWWAIAG